MGIFTAISRGVAAGARYLGRLAPSITRASNATTPLIAKPAVQAIATNTVKMGAVSNLKLAGAAAGTKIAAVGTKIGAAANKVASNSVVKRAVQIGGIAAVTAPQVISLVRDERQDKEMNEQAKQGAILEYYNQLNSTLGLLQQRWNDTSDPDERKRLKEQIDTVVSKLGSYRDASLATVVG